jgi:5-formyltetrahydrofolate cyclo-ligase
MISKQEIRSKILAKRNSLSEEQIKEKSLLIAEKLFSLPEFSNAKTIMPYSSFGSEVQTENIILKALELGKKVVLPATDFKNHRMRLFQISSLQELSENSRGIKEPAENNEKEVSSKELDIIVIPGIAFDERGHRIGFGKGFYDIFLKQVSAESEIVALAFEFQLLNENIPEEQHDVRVKKIVTEKRIVETH